MKRLISLIALAIFAIGQSKAEGWIDVTDMYVVNPRFDNNDVRTGWSGDEFGAVGPHDNAEFYSRTYNAYQEISGLAPGRYRVSVSAFYRSGGPGEDYDHYMSDDPDIFRLAKFYATSSVDEEFGAIALACSGMEDEELGGATSWVGGKFIPNNMDAAYYWFEAGHYQNSLEVTVGNDGLLTIGVQKDEVIGSDWTCLDNWKLEYWGEVVQATKVAFEKSRYNVTAGNSFSPVVVFTPDNVTVRKLTWRSSLPNIATVDENGVVTGLTSGKTIISAKTTDGSELTARCTVEVTEHLATAEQLIINEVMPANIDMFVDPSWNYGGWLELYNPTDISAGIGNYWVSDDPDNLKKAMLVSKVGEVPAHGFLTLWFDHADTRKDIGDNWTNTQVDMKLSVDGGTIYISDREGNLICQQSYPAAVRRASWARKTDGGSEWAYTAKPTPTATNNNSVFAMQQLDVPEVDKNAQVFDGTLQICVSIPSGASLYYTTDGTTPTQANGKESKDGIFRISKTTTYRFRLFQDGMLPSDVVTRSYLAREKNYYLPIVSVVTDRKNLYDNTIGVYVSGSNGKTANQDWTKRNFNMEWDRPVNFEYFVGDESVFNQEVNFSICGGWSRKYEPRSFKLKAAKQYGANELAYPFFDDKPFNKNKVLLLRNGGNDEYNRTRMKDASLQMIAKNSGLRLNYQSYHPAHVLVNGEYYGMLNMREPSNKHYGYANYGYDTDEIDAFEMSVDSGYVQKDGTKEAFLRWYELAKRAEEPEVYQQICDELLDIDDYTNYMAFKFFLNDWDWPHNNCKGFRSRLDGKFHFMVFDLDNCVDRNGNNIFRDFENKRTNTFYGRPEYGGSSITAEVELVTIFLNMLKNEEFKRRFIDTYCIVGGCVFGDEQEIIDIVTGIAENIEEALSWEGRSPWGNGRSFAQGIINAVTGNFKMTMTNMMKSYGTFGLNNTPIQSLSISANKAGGHITLNGIDVPRSKFNGYVFAPITLRAEAPAGHRFVGWVQKDETRVETKTIFDFGSEWKYYDQGSLHDKKWNAYVFSTSNWKTGNAPLGYGNNGQPMGNAATKLDWGTDSRNKRPTYYVRKTFTLVNGPQEGETYTMHYSIDDGMIIYINGQEAELYHMASGAGFEVTTEDYNGSWYEGNNPHEGSFKIDPSMLRKGNNVIAVELHNCNYTSSDMWWDAKLEVSRVIEPSGDLDIVSTDPEYTLPESGDFGLQAYYEPLEAEELAQSVPVRINEVSAANSVYINDYFKKNDWIELYNTTGKDIDVAGCYISDNVNKAQKFQIPAAEGVNTVIPAHGFLVLWCDKLDPISQVHTSFKLAAEGGYIVLTNAEEAWADTLHYCAHDGTMSVGLYPDGGTQTYAMTVPTIGASNRLSTGDQLHEQERPEGGNGVKEILIASNGTMRILSDGSSVTVRSEEPTTAQLAVYNSVGQSVLNTALNLLSGSANTSVANLPAGVYIARATNAEGESCACKFVVR